jgi:iron complex outermembrane receptor protein
MLGAQFANQMYSILNDKFNPYTFDVTYNFFTPRAGLNYNFNDNLRTFVNVSLAKREPRLKDIYDGETLNARPNFRIVDTVNNIYQDPLVQPEEMIDCEAGISYVSDLLKTNLNFYYMDFRNEIVNNGQLDNVGQPVSGNAARSVHRGIELEVEYSPFKHLKDNSLLKGLFFGGNMTLSENYFNDYKEKLGIDTTGNIIYGNDYSGNKILLSPRIIGNMTLGYYTDFGLGAFISMQYIGKQYLDNSEDEKKNPAIANAPGYIHKTIEPYTVFNAGISLNISSALSFGNVNKYLKKLELTLRVNNVFDKLYEPTGNVDSYNTPSWIPAATRNFYMDLKVGF